MTNLLLCPACRTSLYLPDKEDSNRAFFEIICRKCQRKYAVSHAKTEYSASSLEQLPVKKTNQPIQYQRIYRLRVIVPNQTIQAIEFASLGEHEKFSAVPGDPLILLYIVPSKAAPELIFIGNENTAASYQLFSPIKRARKAGSSTFTVTLLGGAIVSLLASFWNGGFVRPLWFAIIPSAVGAGVHVTRRQIQLSKEQNQKTALRLSFEQSLLEQINTIEQRLNRLHQSMAEETSSIARLKVVKEKMSRTDAQLYARRIETFERGIDALEKQLGLSRNLMAGYLKVKHMLEIEYETSLLAEELPENTSEIIYSRLEELKTLEAQKEELSLQVDPQKLLSY